MSGPSFMHLTGRATWERLERHGLVPDARSHALRLASDQEDDRHDDISAGLWQSWRDRRGGALWVPLPPDRCPTRELWRGGPQGARRFTGARWEPVPGLDGEPCLALDADDTGVIWALVGEGAARRLQPVSARDGTLLAPVPAPAGLRDVALCDDGFVGLSEGSLWWRVGAEWREIAGPSELDNLVMVAIRRSGSGALALARGGGGCALLSVRAGVFVRAALPELRHGISLLALPDGDALVGELQAVPGAEAGTARTRFARYRRGARADGHWDRVEAWQIIGHDGGGIALDEAGAPWGTSPRGPRRLTQRPDHFVGDGAASDTPQVQGVLLTAPLDAGTAGTTWHRVYLDVALPEGTGVRVRAFVADRPAVERARGEGGTLLEQARSWPEIHPLDRRPARADRPLAPPAQPPVGDGLTRADDPRELEGFETLEGLIPNPPGRYLQLCIELVGTRRASPALVGVRASFPRPSLLRLLPSWWAEDAEETPKEEKPWVQHPDQRDSTRMDRLLALFEGPLTEWEGRLDALPALWDPAAAPADVLPWLASLIGWTLDARLGEGARRALLLAAAELHRARGTVAGVQRLCEILAGCEVEIVERFRLRRRLSGRLGVASPLVHEVPGAVLGGGLVLAADDGLDAEAWYRAHAHQFLVVLYRERDADTEGLVAQALAATRPAHVAFELRWRSDGLRLGLTSELGLGALDRSEQEIGILPVILGEEGAPLGIPSGAAPTVLHHPAQHFTHFPGPPRGPDRRTS